MAAYARKAYDNVKMLDTFARGPLECETLGFSLPSI
jgi:hypothetical protein